MVFAVFGAEVEFFVEEIRRAEQIEPPEAIRQKFRADEGPCLPVRQKLSPRNFHGGFGGVALDMREFRRAHARMSFRFSVERQPRDDPANVNGARDDESAAPADGHAADRQSGELRDHEWQYPRHEHAAEIGTAI